jgi:hypothetical protein
MNPVNPQRLEGGRREGVMKEIEPSSSMDDFDLDLRIHPLGAPPAHGHQVNAKETDFTCTVPEKTWEETCQDCTSGGCSPYSNFESTCDECREPDD